MAKIVLGAAVQDIRGALNGSVYSRNKGGAYIRTKVSPVQPRTAAQLAQRAIFSNNSKAWSSILTASQRAEWTAFAAANPLTNVFGAAITISGLAAYQQLNAVLATIGNPTISDPPADKSVPPIAAVTGLTFDDTPTVSLTTDAQATSITTKYYVFATPALAPGINPGQSIYRFIGSFMPVAAATTVDITDLWTAKYGTEVDGKQCWVLVAMVNGDSGAVTIGQKFSAIASQTQMKKHTEPTDKPTTPIQPVTPVWMRPHQKARLEKERHHKEKTKE